FYGFDEAFIDSFSPKVINSVTNFHGKFGLLSGTSIEADWAFSTYKEQYPYPRIIQSENLEILTPSSFTAYNVGVKKSIKNKVELEGVFKQVGAGFRAVGSPFLSVNFREYEMKYQHVLFKGRIKAEANYEELRDNISGFNINTNRMKGYGLKLSTSFAKLPNIIFSHAPYQQGNNHPDSLYRTNNQFSIT